ncbi:MAG: hybrid sensor histidine kinase/response regulator [Verrucomicrobiota bacterium]
MTNKNLADILVVDDTPANLELLTEILKSNGYKARPVTGGASALQAAKSVPPDLILLDINMPDMNGYEVCQHLKADEVLKGIPVLFISALGDTADKVTAFRCGGVDYITKPFWTDEVLARVTTHLRLRQLQLEVERHNAHLEETVQLRTREITEARDQLVEAHARLAILDKAKSDFLSLISHELRTPLNGLFGITDLILDGCNPFSSVEELHNSYDVCRSKILHIVDDALLLTQINVDANQFAHEPASFRAALLCAIEYSQNFAKASNVDIGAPPFFADSVIGEDQLLSKALQALLETGVRFAKPGTAIRLSGGASAPNVVLTIETRGRKIPEKFIPHFFDVMAIGEAIVPGADLGLRPAVAERIISLFGGSVTVENLDPAGIRLNVGLKSSR